MSLPQITGNYLEGESFAPQGNYLILGGFDLRAQAEIGVWRRLVQQSASVISCVTIYFLDRSDASGREALEAMTPLSQWSTTAVAESTSHWLELIQPDRPERSFAGLIRDTTIDPLMIGMPTEEAWDRFRVCL